PMLDTYISYLITLFIVDIHDGDFTVENGGMVLPFLKNDQYFRVYYSTLNDGLYQYPASDMTDETFTGTIWALAVPPAVVKLSEEIAAWQEKRGEPTEFTSESFGGYSYSKATGANGVAVGWREVFAGQLKPWKKLRECRFVVGNRPDKALGRPWNPDYPLGGD